MAMIQVRNACVCNVNVRLVRKIAEKYGYKSLPDKFKILEAEIEKRRILSESLAISNSPSK